MDEVKVMDEQQRNESLNRHVELDTTQFIVAQLEIGRASCRERV